MHFNVEPGVHSFHIAVTLNSQLVFPPTQEEKETLIALVGIYDRVIVDARHTDTLSMSWLRLLADLTAIAETATRELLVVGANNAIKSTVDIANLADRIRLLDSMEESD